MYRKIAVRACWRVGQAARCSSSVLSVAKKLSAAALSQHVPGRPTLDRAWRAASRAMYGALRYWPPRSEGWTKAGAAHEAGHALAPHAGAGGPQLGVDARGAIGAVAVCVDRSHLAQQARVGPGPRGGLTLHPGVEAAGRDAEDATEAGDRVVGLL